MNDKKQQRVEGFIRLAITAHNSLRFNLACHLFVCLAKILIDRVDLFIPMEIGARFSSNANSPLPLLPPSLPLPLLGGVFLGCFCCSLVSFQLNLLV